MQQGPSGPFAYHAQEKQAEPASGLERLADVFVATKTSEPGPSGMRSDGDD